jgi:hypothetical protein
MRGKRRATSKVLKRNCRWAKRSHQKLGEDFVADLNRTWEQHAREILDRVMAERPKLYFQALIKLTQVLHRRLPEPPGFDRRRTRVDALQRLELHAGNARQR